MMAALMRIGLRSSILLEARSAVVAASAIQTRLFSASGTESRVISAKSSIFTPVNLPSYTLKVNLFIFGEIHF
jgi:hypothetical protein